MLLCCGGLLLAGGIEFVEEVTHHEGASHYVAEGGEEEVEGELCDAHLCTGEHAAGDEEHVGDAVFVAECDECGYGEPASEGFGAQ